MKFSEKLRKAMKELNLTQTQMVGLIGKSKASISQYLSDKQVPSEARQMKKVRAGCHKKAAGTVLPDS